jgi:DNA-binding HxlR family transcriptional regulator
MANQICTNTPVGVTLKVLGGKWKLLILWHIKNGTSRFGELMKNMPGITQKMLTQDLRQLEDDGIISRKVFAEIPPRVEYKLTEYGRTLDPVLEKISEWGSKHIEKNA